MNSVKVVSELLSKIRIKSSSTITVAVGQNAPCGYSRTVLYIKGDD